MRCCDLRIRPCSSTGCNTRRCTHAKQTCDDVRVRIYWYWPHPHRVANELALGMLRVGDVLTVQALASLHGERFHPVEEYEVVRDLPDPTLSVTGPFARWRRPVEIGLRRSRARRRLLRRGVDVAHLHLLVYQTDWLDVGALARREVLVSTVHDVRPHRPALPVAMESRVLRHLYRRAGHLVVHHETLREELVADFGVDRALIHVVAPAIDLADQRDPSVVKPERPLILLFGSLRENKGIDVLLDAAEIMGDDAAADIVIAGHGKPEMEARLSRERHDPPTSASNSASRQPNASESCSPKRRASYCRTRRSTRTAQSCLMPTRTVFQSSGRHRHPRSEHTR